MKTLFDVKATFVYFKKSEYFCRNFEFGNNVVF